MKGARNLAVIGIAAQILFGLIPFGLEGLLYIFTEWYSYLFPLSGAIAGTISGMNRRRIVAAIVGLVVGVVFGKFVLWPGSLLGMLITLSASPLGALIGVYIEKWKVQT